MKKLSLVILSILSISAFANDVLVEGTITNSIYDQAIGNKCSLSIEKIEVEGARSNIAYNATIKMKVPTRYKKKLLINELTAKSDLATEGMSNVLAGMGGLHRKEISQRLFVFFDDAGRVQKYAYRDGTRSMYGEFTYVCELN